MLLILIGEIPERFKFKALIDSFATVTQSYNKAKKD
jgi:hypothetical protein